MKRNVKFHNRERRMSRGSTSDFQNDSPDEKSNGPAKSPTRNGAPKRPELERADTGQSPWATENEGDEKVYINFLLLHEYD